MKEKIKKGELLNLPVRQWSEESIYEAVLIVPTGKKHDSGFTLMAIIGIVDDEPKEIAGYCDDVCWDTTQVSKSLAIRTDCYYPSGIFHYWSWYCKFKVGSNTSSTDIILIPKENK
jgi:hypothetical protein